MTESAPPRERLSEDERRILWEQYVDTYVKAQETFDASVRTLAAPGVAVTVTLATALDHLDAAGKWAAGFFLVSLGYNLVSYATAQKDMRAAVCGRSRRRTTTARSTAMSGQSGQRR